MRIFGTSGCNTHDALFIALQFLAHHLDAIILALHLDAWSFALHLGALLITPHLDAGPFAHRKSGRWRRPCRRMFARHGANVSRVSPVVTLAQACDGTASGGAGHIGAFC